MTAKIKVNSLRNAEYYAMLPIFDKLYLQSKQGIIFDDIMSIITSPRNIRLAYRNIKNNHGSLTSGVDKKTIQYIKNMKLKKFIKLIQNKFKNYQPQMIRRVYIPKPNGKERPLGIPTIIDRIIEQCILQVLEPIMEAKFHNNSNGFRPNKSTERAIAQLGNYIYRNKCYYVVDIDIKGFFDNVNHGKLLKQLWAMNIQDRKLLKIISLMLKAEIMGEGIPEKGTPQGGILSPLLANVVLNELDWWLSNQWMTYYTKKEFKQADDFKIICKSYQDAVKLKIATINWLGERLGLEVSEEKTKIVNLKRNYSDFLGLKIKVRKKSKNSRYTIISHISDKARKRVKKEIKDNLKDIRKSINPKEISDNIDKYNQSIIGIHQYYNKATYISVDMANITWQLYRPLKKTLKETIELQLPTSLNNGFIENTYGKSKCLKKLYGKYVVPIGYVKYKQPMIEKNSVCKYSKIGRKEIHTGLECMNYETIYDIVNNPFDNETMELNDVIVPKLASQYGKCYISDVEIFTNNIDFIRKNDKISDKDKYQNILVIDKNIKGLLLRKGYGIMELKRKLRKEKTIV